MRINNNISALNAWRGLTNTDNALGKSLEKLSSGLRINRAGDDAAGLAISEKMRGQIRGLNMAIKNAQDGISLIQTAEGALTESHAILQRMRELAVQSANDTNTDEDRAELQKELNELIIELDRIAGNTEFNTKRLLDGSFEGKVHIGANQGQNMEVKIGPMSSESLGSVLEGYTSAELANLTGNLAAGVDVSVIVGKATYSFTIAADDYTNNPVKQEKALAAINEALQGSGVKAVIDDDGKVTLQSVNEFEYAIGTGSSTPANGSSDVIVSVAELLDPPEDGGILTQEAADRAITIINDAIQKVSEERAKLGAYQNRLEHTIKNLGVAAENLAAAESRIRDVDMAQEMMNFTKQNILMQAGTAMLAQANARPQSVLQLLG